MEKKNLKLKDIQLQLLSIKETGFFIDTSTVTTLVNFDISKLIIEFGIKIGLNVEKDLFQLDLLVKYQYPDENKKIDIIELSTENRFLVKKLGEAIIIEDSSKMQDKVGLLPTLMGIAVGALRGILVVKTTGTILADFPLPLVNPTDLCNQLNPQK